MVYLNFKLYNSPPTTYLTEQMLKGKNGVSLVV